VKSKNKKEFINSTSSTELEINGEKIIMGFQSKKNKKPINAIEKLEEQFFKDKKAIVRFSSGNKVMSIDDISIVLYSQAMGPISNELPFDDMNALVKALNRYNNSKK